MQIRCQEGSVYYDAVEAMGAYAQSVAFSELYSATVVRCGRWCRAAAFRICK